VDRPPLACTVRGCGLPLEARPATLVCPRGHSYDIARRGYVNLLQPQDRRSRVAGDAKAIVEARLRLHEAGIGAALIDACVRVTAARVPRSDGFAVDLGCGSGDALAAVARGCGLAGIGIDLSSAAITAAARRFPDCTWVVANADRRLPLADHRVGLVLSLHARRQPAECARVLAAGGCLVVAAPAPDDLAEVRRLVQGRAEARDRVDTIVLEHDARFRLVDRMVVRETSVRARDTVLDLLRVTYRGARGREAAHTDEIAAMPVTLSSDVLIFEARRRG
jgi:23S rRNA (guanine745-N1)-methyltransferase